MSEDKKITVEFTCFEDTSPAAREYARKLIARGVRPKIIPGLQPGEMAEFYNEDGTLAGFVIEPTEEYKRALNAWLVQHVPENARNIMGKWIQHATLPASLGTDFRQEVTKGGENHPARVTYRGFNVSGV